MAEHEVMQLAEACASNRKVAVSIPDGANYLVWSHYGPGVD